MLHQSTCKASTASKWSFNTHPFRRLDIELNRPDCSPPNHQHIRVFKSHWLSVLTLNIPSLARQRCLPSWGPWRAPWFFVISQLFDAVDYSNYVFLGFWNYNSVTQALLASNILCLFISTEVTAGTELLHTHSSLIQHLNNVIFWAVSAGNFSNLQRSEPKNNKNNNILHL